MQQQGRVWVCRRCGEILAVITRGYRLWLNADADRLADRGGKIWLVCPVCRRINARLLDITQKM
jgi:hypothetical protein